MLNKITCGSCYELLANIGDNSVDMLFCDLPYATKERKCTANDWDKPMDLPALWAQFNRVCKPNAAMVFTANIRLASELYITNKVNFRYEWIWVKDYSTGFANAAKRPLIQHELVLVFSKQPTIYNPIFTKGEPYIKKQKNTSGDNYGDFNDSVTVNTGERCPVSLLYIDGDTERFLVNTKDKLENHPTQKPIALLEYLIKTYTNDGATILDPTAGSCTTAVACIQTNRNFICIEQLEKYCAIGRERIKRASSKVASQLFTPSEIHSQTPLF